MSDPKSEFWIDTNDCDESFHCLSRQDAGSPLEAKHADGTPCAEVEFKYWPDSQNWKRKQ
jgi:hypothetical protein